LIKLMSVVSLVLAPWFVEVHGLNADGNSLSWIVDMIQTLFS